MTCFRAPRRAGRYRAIRFGPRYGPISNFQLYNFKLNSSAYLSLLDSCNLLRRAAPLRSLLRFAENRPFRYQRVRLWRFGGAAPEYVSYAPVRKRT